MTAGAPPRKAMERVVHDKDLRPQQGPAGDRYTSPPAWGSERGAAPGLGREWSTIRRRVRGASFRRRVLSK